MAIVYDHVLGAYSSGRINAVYPSVNGRIALHRFFAHLLVCLFADETFVCRRTYGTRMNVIAVHIVQYPVSRSPNDDQSQIVFAQSKDTERRIIVMDASKLVAL